jgi:putative ABC transport system permease protein
VLGVAAIGALLFDMLMLSQGLVTSMGDLFARTGWDVRVTATDANPGDTPALTRAADARSAIAALPEVRAALAVRVVEARAILEGSTPAVTLQGVSPDARPPWTVMRGRDPQSDSEVVVNDRFATDRQIRIGGDLALQASCVDGRESLPSTTFRVVGVAEFPFETSAENTVAGTLNGIAKACGGYGSDEADLILVTSTGDAAAAARAIRTAVPRVYARTNEELIGRLQQGNFSYFRQISTVLTTVTLSFALLLITVLLTVSVNQRLGEIAALRALGFSQRRVVADVLCESALIVGIGGAMSLPLGLLLAQGLDRILTSMPGLPSGLHFFVFEPEALVTHVALLVVTAVAAALYPMRIVARLPIASTLRDEVVG